MIIFSSKPASRSKYSTSVISITDFSHYSICISINFSIYSFLTSLFSSYYNYFYYYYFLGESAALVSSLFYSFVIFLSTFPPFFPLSFSFINLSSNFYIIANFYGLTSLINLLYYLLYIYFNITSTWNTFSLTLASPSSIITLNLFKNYKANYSIYSGVSW